MKVVIPVAGMGSRLRPHTHTQPKSLVPVAGKPLLAHIIDSLLEQGLQDFVFIIGYLGDKVELFIRENYEGKLNMTFVVQEPREGLAHALWVAKEQLINEEQILVVLGDTIAHLNWKALLSMRTSAVGVKKVSQPVLFGIAETDPNGRILRLEEKPKIPKSNLALVGIYKLNNLSLLFDSIRYLIDKQLKNRGEYHLTDALQRMIEQGEEIYALPVRHWYDCGKKETILEANAILLNQGKYKTDLPHFPNTIIIPPVSIGQNCKISNSIIGPNVAIGNDAIVHSSIISNSIIGSFSHLDYVVLHDSIIGNDSALKGLRQSLNIGDNTEINFQ